MPSMGPSGYPVSDLKSQGCFSDSANGRALANSVTGVFFGTAASCLQACANAGYKVCGIENGNECWGANTLTVTNGSGHKIAATSCTAACSGDTTQTCGGQNAISIYSTLRTGLTTDGTAAGCLKACSDRGFNLCGLEYYGECWGGNFLATTSKQISEASCSYTCTKDTAHFCGGSNALSLYANSDHAVTDVPAPLASYAGYSYQDCYTDNSAGRRELPNYLGNTGTATGCLDACKAAGSKYCGLECSGECWGGDTLAASMAPSPGKCTMDCNNAAGSICGGPDALTLYTAQWSIRGKSDSSPS
ncbi:hypothetical protein RQP46_007377 [Phenoliferia psychrophenolica]